jgi:2-methylcitrate dehydratase PrpD
MSDSRNASQVIARFVVETPAARIPDKVRHEAKRSLLNILGTGIRGGTDPTYQKLLQALPTAGHGAATIVGRNERTDALNATFLNAAGANIDDFCDTHLPTVIHPTAPVMPALYAMSELQRVGGADLLNAFAIGVEVACRIGNSISPSHYRTRGWHITASCGVFGAAAAAGRLLGLDVRQMVWALGGAATQAAGLVEMLGMPTKSLGVGSAARNGLLSAQLAKQGFEGPAHPLEGRFGFFNAVGDTPKWPALLDGLGETWELSINAYKPYPGGVVIHPVIDGVLELRAKAAFKTADIARILVHGHPLLSERADRPNVTTGREAQVSVQHSVAAAQIFGDAGLDQYTDACVNDPAVLELRRKVEVAQDAGIPVEAAVVELWTQDGKHHRAAVDAARGSAGRPLTDRELEEKFAKLAGPQLKDGGRGLIDAVWAIDKSEDASKLLAMSVPT